jgi:hypothetical protein
VALGAIMAVKWRTPVISGQSACLLGTPSGLRCASEGDAYENTSCEAVRGDLASESISTDTCVA